MTLSVVTLPGDGVGPEVTAQAIRVLQTVSDLLNLSIEIHEELIGGAALDSVGNPLPEETIARCHSSNAVFLGAVGGPQWEKVEVELRPEQGLLGLRKALGLFANLRPIKIHPALMDSSALRPERLKEVDILIIRELTGGLYFGKRGRSTSHAFDTCEYSVSEVERIARLAGNLAKTRRGKVTSVDKANVLDTSRLWRDTVNQVFAAEFADIKLEHNYVDAAAMYLLSRPADFDVLLTENMFGDILSDEASMLSGSLGLLPSASLSTDGPGLFEPIHGSAPDIAGQNIANPCGAILSVGMLLRHSLNQPQAADAVEQAVAGVLEDGLRTSDLAIAEGDTISTTTFGDAVLSRLTF
ncbi:MAG: 3-isopropylmalate dehydrogenase [Pseudomonadota bacterium]|nr:3-isopropylmalate dehydrogenase [Pseudomonadota bacterium]